MDSVHQAGAGAVQHEVVVVASAILELRVRLVNAGTDWRGNPKVERCVP
jgi:hypothetical protein